MSPRWRDEVAIYLAPRKVALARRARGIGSRVVATTEIAVPAGAAGDAGPALARLGEVLSDPAWHAAAARVVVADHPWARFAVVPWPAARLDAAGHLAHARYVLADAFGEAVADWAVALGDAAPGHASIACAMPASLRPRLESTLAPARLALVSLQPRLVVAFNAWRRWLPRGDAWFVSVDEAALAAAHLADGTWDRVHVARLPRDWTLELERLRALGRVSRAAGAPGRMLVDAPAWMRAAEPGAGIEWLDAGEGEGTQGPELGLLRRMYA